MEGETGVLQDRVDAVAVERSWVEALERVRREHDEGEEAEADHALHGKRVGLESRRQVAAIDRQRRSEQRQDQHPEQHRAFVVRPYAGDFVEEGLRRVRVGGHDADREVRRDEGPDQRCECGDDAGGLCKRGLSRVIHQRRLAPPRADQRYDRLGQRDREGQQEGEVADFWNHAD